MPIQRKNLFLTWGIRISLVPVILVLFALGLIAIVLFAICGVCGRFLAALGGLAALLALFDKCYQEAPVTSHQPLLVPSPPSWHSCSVLTARRRCCSGWAESCSSLLVVCMIYTTDWRNL